MEIPKIKKPDKEERRYTLEIWCSVEDYNELLMMTRGFIRLALEQFPSIRSELYNE